MFSKNQAFLFAVFCVAALLPSVGAAQGWRMFIDDVKREAQDKKKAEAEKERGAISPPNDVDATSDFSGVEANDEAFAEPIDETPCGVRAPVSSGGLLDFSDALVDDAAEKYGDAENVPTAAPASVFAPNLPGWRDFPEMKNDARLNDVSFVSRTRGWVVGDRGTILTTFDGGETWRLLDSTTDANLYAISFFDENFGLAVGGEILPSARVGRGVVLRTIDGGETWGEIETAAFPILRDVKILDEGTAWIAGDSSESYPSGLFASADSGLTWNALSGNKRGGWRAVLFDPIERIGVGTTVDGGLQTVDDATAERRTLPIGLRRLRDVAFDAATGTAWLVGETGFASRSSDFGANWARTPGALPNDAERFFDLESVAAVGGFVGAVGAPGTLFFYSNDGGNVWNAAPTGTKTPLRKVFFVDRETGWAVGDLGTIVATCDGGKTWSVKRSGGTRVALLGIFGRAKDVPFEPFVQLSGDEGYLSEICLVARETAEEALSSEIPIFERFNEAVVETGASGATQGGLFSLESETVGDSLERILERFDRENDGDGLERFREYLVRQLRTWRPDALLTVDSLQDAENVVAKLPSNADLTSPQGTGALLGALAENSTRLDDRSRDAFRSLILRELPLAIRSAGDPTVYPEHLTACGLETWNVSKVRVVCRGQTQGDLLLDASYFCPTLGRPVGEIAKKARRLVFAPDDDGSQAVETTHFQTLLGASLSDPNDPKSKTFFAGIPLPKGGDARRAAQAGRLDLFDAASARAGDRRQKLGVVDALTRKSDDAQVQKRGELLLAQLRGAIQNVDEEFAVEYLSRAGRNFAKLGNYSAAEEAYSIVALELPESPNNREALSWLVRYYCSTEAAAQTDEAISSPGGPAEFDATRRANAAQLGEAIRTVAPETFMSPEVRFSIAAARRASGDVDGALQYYWNRAIASRADVWGARAQAEFWLSTPNRDALPNGEQFCPFATANCRFVASRPYLDGNFEPNFWDAAAKFALSSPLPEPPPTRELDANEKAALARRDENRKASTPFGTTVALLADSEFLYVGVVCPKSSAFRYSEAENASNANQDGDEVSVKPPRPRDADLTDSDRVEFQFDVDGDYSTFARFSFDCRGWAADELWANADWNPEIFVAKKETNADWRLEIAIPLAALTNNPPKNGDVWRFSARRVVPNVGVECWNVENSERTENGFGFLTFGN